MGYRSRVPLGSDTVVHRRGDVITEAVLDDVVVLDPETSRYVRLNATSAYLWDLLGAAPATVAALAEALERERGAPAARAPGDAQAFVDAMLSRGLVEL